MTTPTTYVGIDIAKAKFDVALLNPLGKYRSKVFANTPEGYHQFLTWLQTQEALDAHLCMETTGAYGRGLARFLTQQNLLVSVVNPAQIHAFGKTELVRAKTDKADARLIARYCQMHRPAPWVPPTDEIVSLQALVQRLDDLLGLQNMESNRLETAESAAKPSIDAVLVTINQQVDAVRRQIQEHIDNHPDLKSQKKLLLSIPGAYSTPFGHSIHRHPATGSTMIRPPCPRPFGRGRRSVATRVKGRYADGADGVNRCFFRMDSPSIVSL